MSKLLKIFLVFTALMAMAQLARATEPGYWSVTVKTIKHHKPLIMVWQGAKTRSKRNYRWMGTRMGDQVETFKVDRITSERLADRVAMLTLSRRKPASSAPRCALYVELKSHWGTRRICRQEYATDSELQTLIGDLRRLR